MFQEPFPELKARPPVMPGQSQRDTIVTILGKPIDLNECRRQQLYDLARAWDIKVRTGATKQDMLPVLTSAAQSGIFNGPPLDDWWLRKAGRSPDSRGVIIEGLPKQKLTAPEPVEQVETNYEDPRPIAKRHIGQIRKAAAAAGMKLGKGGTKEAMLDYLKSKGIE